jgi:uncharacterized protein involved in exopolysaccharide biosynthesis
MSFIRHMPTIESGSPPTPSQGALNREPAITFRPNFRRSLEMHPRLAGAVSLTAFLLVLAFALTLKPHYLAECLVYVEPSTSKILADGTTTGADATAFESALQQQTQTAQRMDTLVAALRTLPANTWQYLGATPEVAALGLKKDLKVARVTTSYQLSISLAGPDPVKTAAIVNAVTDSYLEASRRDERAQADQRSQLLVKARKRVEDELAQVHSEQTQLGTSLGIANPSGEGSNPFDTQLDTLRGQLIAARANHDVAAAQLAALSGPQGSHTSGLSAAASDAISADPGLASMKSTINQRRAILSSQMAGLTPNNPIYKQDQEEIADLDKTLEGVTTRMREKAGTTLQDKLRSDLDRTADIQARISAQIARQTADATSAAPKLQRAGGLQADVLRLNTRYAAIDNAQHNLELETTGPGVAHLALSATVPSTPEPDRKRLVELASLPVGLLFGLGAAVFARKQDHRIYIGTDIDDVLGFSPITLLPAPEEVSDRVMGEYFLRLAAGVESAYRSGGARTFLVTAANENMDVSGLVSSMQRKLAMLGMRVVVVTAQQIFEGQVVDGGSASKNQALRFRESATGFDRRSEGMAGGLFERLKTEYDIVIITSLSLLISAQAEYIARCADATILVAESGVTSREDMFECAALLQKLNVRGVGTVLESVQLRNADAAFKKQVSAVERIEASTLPDRSLRASNAPPNVPPQVSGSNNSVSDGNGNGVKFQPPHDEAKSSRQENEKDGADRKFVAPGSR